MPSDSYSFLDVAVLDAVRRRFAAGDALVILSADLDEVLWANGPGAALFGHAEIERIIGAPSGLAPLARRQIMATAGFPDIGADRSLAVRLAGGMTSRAVGFLASGLAMPDGEKAILMAVPATEGADAARAIGGFAGDGHFVAFLDGKGAVEAASEGFAGLGIPPSTLAALVAEVAPERDRIVKRLVPAGGRSCPAGIARLTDEPARHLLVVVEDGRAAPAADAEGPPAPRQAVAPASGPADVQPHHDHWYFSSDQDEESRETPAPAPVQPAAADAPSGTDAPAAAAAPVRFVWRTDAEGRFSAISPEFADAVGAPAADIAGRRFRDVATTFALDPAGEISSLLERRDTWSGRSVLWPLAGTGLKVPVDLAALPVYGRGREFEGFRGFGVARMGDAVEDPEGIGLALVPNPPEPEQDSEPGSGPESGPDAPGSEAEAAPPDPFRGEVPALEIAPQPDRRFTDKIIRLAEHRQPANGKGLSSLERSAFREIGERLRKDSPVQDNSAPAGPAQASDEAEGETPSEAISAPDTGETPPPAHGSLLDYAGAEPATADEDGIAAADFRDAQDDGDLPPPEPEPEPEPAPVRAEPAPSPPPAGGFLPSAFARGEPDAPDVSILARLPVPILIHSGDVLYYANDEFLDLAGYETLDDLDEAGGLGVLFGEPYGDDEAAGEARRALRLRTRQGDELPVEATLRAVPWQERKALLLVVRRTGETAAIAPAAPAPADETPQPMPAAALQQQDVSELKARIAEMRTIIDTATDGVVLIGRDGNIRSISRPAEALFGFDGDDVAGKPFTSLFAIESQRAARDYLGGLSEHGVASVLNDGREVIGREAQGRFIPLFMTIGRLPGDSGFCAVVRDITQWKRAEEDLTQARAVAERASSQKTDFLARISHEIRTPLNAIIGFSELMVDEKFGPVANDRYRDYLRDINRSGNHVLDLVNDLLDISKIEAGQQDMNYEAVSLNDTLAETVALMQPQANRERVIIRSSFASRLPEVVADLRSVRQIALNILSNAIRYTQAGGQVIVSTAYEVSGDVVMRVRDTGIGMTQAEIEQALKPFKQINALKRGRGDGTGLGLPLTKAMVEANRARFTITSTPGEGTLVEIAFPSTRVLAE